MNHKLQRICTQLFPYLLIGTAIAIVVGLFIMLSCVLLWGMIIGAAIWLGSLVKKALFPPEQPLERTRGRIIEHNKER